MSESKHADTLVALFQDRVQADGDRVALHVPRGDSSFRAVTWNELSADVRRVAAGLVSVGVQPGDRVAQVSENRYEWIVADLAIMTAGAVHVPLHASLSPQQIAWQIKHSDAEIVLLTSGDTAQRLNDAGADLSSVRAVYAYEAPVHLGSMQVLSFHDLSASVSEEQGLPVEAEGRMRAQPEQLATVLFSSGATGEPKGIMLSHRNLITNARGVVTAYNSTAEDVRLSWLPWSHIFARTCDLYTWIQRGSQLAIAESREKILANCQQIRPTVMNGVPYFFDKVQRHLIQSGEGDKPDRLKELLGGRIRMCCSGGVALSDVTAEFFTGRGVLLVQGYGLTETSPVISISSREHNKLGSVGRALADVEIRIADDGEILTRGPHVMLGYWKDDAATARVIHDGWFATGDLGRLDDDGYLWITGRKKEILVTAGGKNVAPAYLERLLTDHPLIEQAFVCGDNRNYLAALIVPNPDALRAAIISRGIPVTSREEALVHPQVYDLYRQAIDAQLRTLAHCEQIGRFTILGRGFSIEQGEITPSLKLRRQSILQNFADTIEAMYTPLN